MQILEDSLYPTTAMNMTVALLAKVFKVNTIPTNNNPRSSLIPLNCLIAQLVQNDRNEVRKNAIQNPGIQNVKNMNGLSGFSEIANQYGNGNVVTASAEGNGNGSMYTNLQTELDRTKEKLKSCIIKKKKEYAVLWNNWYTKCEECKYDKTSYDKAYNDMQQKMKRLQAQLEDLKGKSSDTQCASNILVLLSQKPKDENVSLEFQLCDTIYENAKLRAQLFDKVSKTKVTTKGTRTNTMFTKQSILGKPHSSSYKPKLYSVTPFPKSSVLPKVDKTNALSKPVTSNSTPSLRESKVMQNVNVIAPRIFRTNPSKTSRVDNIVPNKPVKTIVRIKPITVSQPNVIHKQQANSNLNNVSSTRVNKTAKTRRPHPRSKSNTDRVLSKSKSSCISNNVKKIEENHRNS
nr:hypothetical protein [Tanacetum cinerariifolium]